jgi:prophage antirepressor-like protein
MTELELVQSFSFEFYGEMYEVHLASDGQLYIRLSDVCDAIGLDTNSQRRRIREDEAISHHMVNMKTVTPYQDSVRKQAVTFFNIQGLVYWLLGVDAKRVSPETRQKVMRFKQKFAKIAWQVYRSEMTLTDEEGDLA